MKLRLITGLLFLYSALISAKEGHLTELVGSSGEINWTTASVSADGYGIAPEGKKPNIAPLLACRAATVDAQRNLLESFQGVRVTATTLVSNYMLTSDEVKSSVEGTIQGATIKSRKNRADGVCKVTLQASLRGKTANSIYQRLYNNDASAFNITDFFSGLISSAHAATLTTSNISIEQQLKQLTNRVAKIEALLAKKKHVEAESTSITGVVIDVRGSHFIPSLDPKIRQLSGDILYPSKKSTEDIINNGQLVSLFSNDVDFAMAHPTIGASPLLIKAHQTLGGNLTEITLSESDANKIAYLANNNSFENISVIIVL